MRQLSQLLQIVNHRYLAQLLAAKSPIAKREWVVALLIFVIFTVAFCKFQLVTAWLHHLDSAFLMETLESIKNTGIPISYVEISFVDVASTFSINAESLCKSELMPSGRGMSILDIHAYYILYPLAAFTWLFPPHVILAVINGFGFASVIFILYWVIRRQGVPILGAIAFCFLVMAHPAWSHAALGDFYADRFFMPLGLLYVFLLHDAVTRLNNISRKYLLLTLAVGLLAASTTERGAIMIALFTIASLVLYKKNIADRGEKIVLAIFAIALLGYVFLYFKLRYVNHAGNGSLVTILQGIPHFIEQYQDPTYAAKAREFIVINVLLFGIFALFDWRLALIAIAALLPNLLTTIGGAEKTGWATHYHSMYFPFVAFAAAIGYCKLWELLGDAKYRLMLVVLLLALIPAISNYSIGYGSELGAVKRLNHFYAQGAQSYEKQMAAQLKQIAAAIPAGAKVTTTERFVPTLYRDRTIYYYPVGIDVADYAVLTKVIQPDGSFYYAGAISYIAGESKKVDMCLTDRLKRAGYDLAQPRLLIGDLVVLERRK